MNGFFVVLGVLFLLLIIAGAYVVVADPFGLRPIYNMLRRAPATVTSSTGGSAQETRVEKPTAKSPTAPQNIVPTPTTSVPADPNPLLTPEQEAALSSLGIDPASLPSEITPAMEACFTGILGASRVAEIKAGSDPTPLEFFQVRSCL